LIAKNYANESGLWADEGVTVGGGGERKNSKKKHTPLDKKRENANNGA